MNPEDPELLAQTHIDIDNGGVSLTIKRTPVTNKEDDFKNFEVILSTEYFGYPCIETRLLSNYHLTHEHLRQLAKTLEDAAEALETL